MNNNSQFSIQLQNLSFNYNNKTLVFDKHNLELKTNSNQANKLYGIIGPSGTGKTTLVSILGGQLKPDSGNVLIDNTNIYEVDDTVRRGLIAVQMQTSTSLRGALKYNLTFGLPKTDDESPIYSDQYLIDLLVKVGLWSLFKDKDGLETLIGEGGLNLSGGQRQRLNFAGLYLRADYFKPSLILIDEPTSRLDEISEKAITDMINELAGKALTLVVAHRLKTLEQAVAILDSSLILAQKQMEFYTREDLLRVSKYYQDLMAGNAKLEE